MGGSDKVVSICPVYCSSWLGVFFHLDYCFFSKLSHIKFIIREPDFPEEWLMLPEMVRCTKNGSKTCFSWIHWKDWSWIFTEFVLFGMFLHKSHTWENFSFWDMGQSVLQTIILEEFFINDVSGNYLWNWIE